MRVANTGMAGVAIPTAEGFYVNLGDVPSAHGQEQALWEALGSPLPVRELKVSHHGSHSSSGFAFLARVCPREAWISAGFANRYGHPHAEVLGRLDSLGVPWRGTWEEGGLLIRE